MPAFNFSSAGELQYAVKYLSGFDDTIVFVLEGGRGSSSRSLRLSIVHVPPFCFTDVVYDNQHERSAKRVATEEVKHTWEVDCVFLMRVLGTFELQEPLTMELGDTLNTLYFYQRNEESGATRVAQIGVMFNLGQNLVVCHSSDDEFVVDDVPGFRQLVRQVSVSDEDVCDVVLQREYDGTCALVITTSTVATSMRLAGCSLSCGAGNREASARCSDLSSFAALCGSLSGNTQKVTLSFGQGGLALLSLRWATTHGERSANIFFCSA